MPGSVNHMGTIDVSWTVTLLDQDITNSVFLKIIKLIDEFFDMGVVCLERGTRMKKLHAQCSGRLFFVNDEKGVKWLANQFRKELESVTSLKIKHQFKLFGSKQSPRAMVGYCLKQSGQPYFRMHAKGISIEEMNAARAEYSTLSSDPAEGKITIIRKNVFKTVYGAYKTDYYPSKMSFVEVLSNMLNRDYYLDSTFLIGQGLNIKKCELMWQHISQRRKLNPSDVQKMMFDIPKGIKNKDSFVEDVLFKPSDFIDCQLKQFIIEKIQSRCNFMIIGGSNIGKTQIVLCLLESYFRSKTQFIIIRTKEELKLVNIEHHSIILDDFTNYVKDYFEYKFLISF
jgi:hypothetical protein